MKQKTKDPTYVGKTLRWVNELRQGQGLGPLDRLPRGDHCNVPCSLEKALPFVDEMHQTNYLDHNGVTQQIPYFVTQFVKAVDDWRIPNYCAEA